MNKIGYALIGAGSQCIATSCHLPALLKMKDSINLTLMDINVGVKDYAQKYNLKYTTNYDEILQDESIQIVDICTPDQFHCAMTIKALKAGKHVMCQKPMALSLEDAEKMKKAAKLYNRNLQIMTCMRYSEPYEKIKSVIDSGDIGDIKYIKYSHRGRYFPYPKGNFYRTKESGGQLLHNGMHFNDLIFWFMGKTPTSVSAHSFSDFSQYDKSDIMDSDNYFFSSYGFDNGEIAELELNLMYPKLNSGGADTSILIIGTKGIIVHDQSKDHIIVTNDANMICQKFLPKNEEPWVAFYRLIKGFIKVVINNDVQEVPIEFSLNVLKAIIYSMESMDKSKPVKINN